MGEIELGWIAAVLIGGGASWFADTYLKSETGAFLNIIVGLLCALVVLTARLLGFGFSASAGFAIAGFIWTGTVMWAMRILRA